jgi:putative peptidoglycan lipid II flippase
MAKERSLLRYSSALSFWTLVSRILGLFREMTKASLLGTSAYSDAFSVAFLLPNLFRRLFAEGSISAAFIPTFKEYLLKNNQSEIHDFICAFWTFLTFIVSIAVSLGIFFAPFIVPVFGLSAFDETTLLTRIMFPYLLFISIAAFFQGILNTNNSFIPSAFAPVLLNISTIGFAWLLSPIMDNPARAMAVGILTGGFLEAAIQLPFVLKKKFYFNWTLLSTAIKNPGTRKVLRLVGPTIIGMAAYQLNDLVSTAFAGRSGEGIVSALQYSLRLQELFLGVFAVSIGTVLLPQLSEDAKSLKWDSYNKRLKDAVFIIALITIPVTFFSLLYGETLIKLLFQTRRFDERSVALTLEAFRFHIAGLFFIALNRILAPAFYAQSDSVSPTLAGIISFAVNIALVFLLNREGSGAGIAFALSAAGAVNTLLLLFFLRKNRMINLNSIIQSSLLYIIKIVVVSALALIPVYFASPFVSRFIMNFNFTGKLISLAVPFLFNAFFFAALGVLILFISRDRLVLSLVSALRRGKKAAS